MEHNFASRRELCLRGTKLYVNSFAVIDEIKLSCYNVPGIA